ncbi:MAG: DUF488 domain-containing protein [Chloroflexi bacterium]|nr:DUF488 domain-containing protein [Chloroflexota bacterium]MCL5273431.1 DUF488 domain-containing protein [Chloroflexota bacterium]
MELYTIGFTQKRARDFFGLLRANGIRRLVDIRLKPGGQLSGFAKQDDLPYFLDQLADGCAYTHLPILAPTKEILSEYRASRNWRRYEERFLQLMGERNIPDILDRSIFDPTRCCLLCSEATPEHCHRRLVAELLTERWPNVNLTHL